MEKLLNIEEASQLLGFAKKTIYTYICQRKIPYLKIQSSVRFRESDLEDWLEKQIVRPLRESE